MEKVSKKVLTNRKCYVILQVSFRKLGERREKMNERILKAETVRAGLNYSTLATTIGLSKSGFYAKIRNGGFTQNEICAIRQTLGLSDKLTIDIFFTRDVS
jgi:hypothetical protein